MFSSKNYWSPTKGTPLLRYFSQRKISRGEARCAQVLTEMRITYQREYCLPTLSNRYFDFYFLYNSIPYLLEYDGVGHFKEIPFFKGTLESRQRSDQIKSRAVLKSGHGLIRIDYTQFDKIKAHLKFALYLEEPFYLSTPEMYRYLELEDLESAKKRP